MKYGRWLGFSLMEMLMVLLVIALISLSFFTVQQRGKEVDKSEDLGYRLYEYGQALGEYLRTEGKNYAYTPGEPMQIVHEGYAWLQALQDPDGHPYLSKDFSLVVEPLFVENIPGQQTPMMTQLAVFLDPATNKYELQLETITIGPVYSQNDVQTDDQGNRTYVQDVSLLSRAVNYANEYRDNIKGSGIVEYARVEVGTQPPPGGPNPPAFSSPSLIEGTLNTTNLWNDAWLLRSGANTMQGPIEFEDAAKSDIRNVDNLFFKPSGTGIINQLQGINFKSGGTIYELQALNFATDGHINNLDKITFSNKQYGNPLVFKGLRYIGTTTKTRSGTYNLDDSGGHAVPFQGSFCFITSVNAAPAGAYECTLSTIKNPEGGDWYVMILKMDSTGSCSATCYGYY